MQTNKPSTKTAAQQPKVRTLKIQLKFKRPSTKAIYRLTETYPMPTHVPEIRFSGSWLQELGFLQGRRVSITAMNEVLVIRLQPE